MSVPTESITQERLRSWSRRLAEQHSTPLALIGIGHDSKVGQLVVLTVEDVDDDTLVASLLFAVEQLRPGTIPKQEPPP